MLSFIGAFAKSEDSAAAIEYTLIAALITVAAIVAMTTVGGSTTS